MSLEKAAELQNTILSEINNPENHIFLQVQKKELSRENYLGQIRRRCEKAKLKKEETDDIIYLVDRMLWGFGILEELIENPDISDIRLINENSVRIKKKGKRYGTNIKFKDKTAYRQYIEFITSRNNTNMSLVNAAQVFTDKDSCPTDILRFSLVSDLVNTGGNPSLLIRKIPKKKKTFEQLISENYLTVEQRDYLIKRWVDGYGFLVCGPNGSGKTTLCNALLESTPKNKSAVINQESEELFCDGHPEMVFRKVIPPKGNSNVVYTLRELCRLALMESFDIIVVGEIKGDEAEYLSYATYTGSQAMTTVHSINATEGLDKIIDYALDAQPGRSRDHFAKQFQSLNTIVYVEDYHIKEIITSDGWDRNKHEYKLHYVTDEEIHECLTSNKQKKEKTPKKSPINIAIPEWKNPVKSISPIKGTAFVPPEQETQIKPTIQIQQEVKIDKKKEINDNQVTTPVNYDNIPMQGFNIPKG